MTNMKAAVDNYRYIAQIYDNAWSPRLIS